MEIKYTYQEISNTPGFPGKDGLDRTKPWGTGHAVLSCDGLISGPFAVINADDYYGKNGFIKAAEFLKNMKDENKDEYLLPIIADGMLKEGTEFTVLPTDDQWFGVTYREDKPTVEAAFRNLIEDGECKADLYSDL